MKVAKGAWKAERIYSPSMHRIDHKRRVVDDLSSGLAAIPAGWFLMGCAGGRDAAGSDVVSQDSEQPVHRVWVDEFLLAVCQVTNAEYAYFVEAIGAAAPPFTADANLNQPAQPVVGVSWFEATRYCEWLSTVTGKKFRLPTEAEWERAARGGREGELYPWGNTPPQALPDYAERCTRYWKIGPEPVSLGTANGYGLYNMCDNVHEWCSDWYA